MFNKSKVTNYKIRLVKKLVNDKKVTGYNYIYLSDGSRGYMSIQSAWLRAKSGEIENVIAVGNPVIPEPDIDCIYHFDKSEIAKMSLRGVNGFKISNLPCAENHYILKKKY